MPLPERIRLLHTISIPQLAYQQIEMSIGHNFSEAAEKALREESVRILKKAASLLPRAVYLMRPFTLFRALDS